MKKIILIGDSIRMGYQPVVAEILGDSAEVSGPEQNGGDSRNVLSRLAEWVFQNAPDIVHINCGLHDIKKDKETGEISVPIGEYAENVNNIFNALRQNTEAEIIWATTTPVNYKSHHEKKDFDRFEEDVEAFNKVAEELAKEKGIKINDLNKVVENKGVSSIMTPDGVHYTQNGYRVLGEAVANKLKALL